ncbi:MAG TPA: class I SAM-dependent methyltransferase [Chthoniobacterales bacterium]
MSKHSPQELQRIYAQRFADQKERREAVWAVLIKDYFQKEISPESSLLELGCGHGEFLRMIRAREKYGMDLNPDATKLAPPGVTIFEQDCSHTWPLSENSLDVIFTSNFFEHLPDKQALSRTLDEVTRCLKPQGRLIALGPNIAKLHGRYWHFWDHHLALTDLAFGETLKNRGFVVECSLAAFLPYTMANGRTQLLEPKALALLTRLYLKTRLLWPVLGKQFLLIARKP